MKRLLVLLLLAAGAYFGYREVIGLAPAKTFDQFAEAWARGRTEDAMKLADGASVRRTLEQKSFLQVICPPWTVDAFHGFHTTVTSSATNASGDLEMDVEQTIGFDPPGVTSGIGGAVRGKFRHAATLRKTPDGWKVVAFTPKCESVTPTRGR